jgi:hypothetical protein
MLADVIVRVDMKLLSELLFSEYRYSEHVDQDLFFWRIYEGVVFSFDLVLVPLHLDMHWILAVIDFNHHEVRYYDSMNGNNNECLKKLKELT